MNRLAFINTCGAYCLGGIGLTTLLESCASSNYYAVHRFENSRVVVSKSEFIYLKDKAESIRPFILVKNEKLEFPICIYRFSATEYSALYLQCTHQGCEVHPYPNYLVCPCHGSEFTNKGVVLQPPAENNLKVYPISMEEGTIVIQV
jgi:Rieske Fe-S protein